MSEETYKVKEVLRITTWHSRNYEEVTGIIQVDDPVVEGVEYDDFEDKEFGYCTNGVEKLFVSRKPGSRVWNASWMVG
jgi:hypothetical protein